MKKPVKVEYYREWIVVPMKGTNPYELDPAGWDAVHAMICPHCKKAIGEGVGAFRYHPGGQFAHIRCVENAEAMMIDRRDNAYLIEAAAKLAKLTISQFRELPSYEKDKYLNELDQHKPTVPA
jgi:hypothetical protein